MRKLKFKGRKGLSEIVAYVLLIVIAISISLLVYTWMKNYLPKPQKECPDNVALIIEDYSCGAGKTINITLRNKGLFDVDGFIVKIANKSGSLPIYSLKGISPLETEGRFYFVDVLGPDEKFSNKFSYEKYNQILEIEIIPTKRDKKELLLCDRAAIRQKIENCGSEIVQAAGYWVYQEDADETATDGSWDAALDVYDGDWSTASFVAGAGIGTLLVNYTKISGASREASLWQVKDTIGIKNLTIPISCWDYNGIKIMLRGESVFVDSVNWSCYDGSWQVLRSVSTGFREIYEDAMVWHVTG